jgi:hypothetical protein
MIQISQARTCVYCDFVADFIWNRSGKCELGHTLPQKGRFREFVSLFDCQCAKFRLRTMLYTGSSFGWIPYTAKLYGLKACPFWVLPLLLLS